MNSAYYMNFKYGDALPEGAEGKLILMLGVRNDNSTDADGNVTHVCPAPGDYIAVVRMANIENLKHITLTVNLTITE